MAEASNGSFAWPAPRANPHLVGHEEALKTLVGSWQSARLAHAWMLTGPRGIGKATLAFRFARMILGGEPALAPSHDVFHRIAAGSHAGLATVERTVGDRGALRSEIVVADVRKVSSFLSLTAGEGTWRVIVVDAAEELNGNAANALLKRLEEPPDRVLFLLVSHVPSRVLPTVRSRCRVLAMHPLNATTLEGLLAEAMAAMPESERRLLARLAEGSPGRAASLAAQGGVALYKSFIGLVRDLPEVDAPALHGLGDGLAGRDGVDRFRTLAELMLWWLGRSIRRAAMGINDESEEIVPGEAAAARLFDGPALDRWVDAWEKTDRLFAQTDVLNLDPKQALIGAFVTLQEAAQR